MELYSTRSFTKAAIRLGISQPSLTQGLIRLEQKMNCQLIFRDQRNCEITEDGQHFYQLATQLTATWDQFARRKNQDAAAVSGIFRLGCHASVGTYCLPGFLNELNALAPHAEIHLIHDISRNIAEMILSRKLDFGFVVNPIKSEQLVLTKLGKDEVGLFRSKSNPAKQKLLFADTNLLQTQSLLAKPAYKKFADYKVIESSSLELIRGMITEGAGIGILPQRIANLGSDLSYVDEGLPRFQDEIYFCYRADSQARKTATVFVAAAKKALI